MYDRHRAEFQQTADVKSDAESNEPVGAFERAITVLAETVMSHTREKLVAHGATVTPPTNELPAP